MYEDRNKQDRHRKFKGHHQRANKTKQNPQALCDIHKDHPRTFEEKIGIYAQNYYCLLAGSLLINGML